jgi:uncharacterized protein with ATP-grasp and redox domains
MLSTGELDSFARLTIQERIPAVARKVVSTNPTAPAHVLDQITRLADDIAAGHLIPPPPPSSSSSSSSSCFDWNVAYLTHLQGKSWHDAPWFIAEAYFYRIMLEIWGYEVDLFKPQKLEELKSLHVWELAKGAVLSKEIEMILHFCLWGNRSDLCYLKVSSQDSSKAFQVNKEKENILIDHSKDVQKLLFEIKPLKIDVICDNSGAELMLDLVLVDTLLKENICSEITLHVKKHPTFVSDATIDDVLDTIKAYSEREESELNSIGFRLSGFLQESKKLVLMEHEFWNSWMFFSDIPQDLLDCLNSSDLVISKGDANYRRFVQDTRWPVYTKFEEIATYLPKRLLCIRTLKSDAIVGLESAKIAETLDARDARWRVNGTKGIIHLIIKKMK